MDCLQPHVYEDIKRSIINRHKHISHVRTYICPVSMRHVFDHAKLLAVSDDQSIPSRGWAVCLLVVYCVMKPARLGHGGGKRPARRPSPRRQYAAHRYMQIDLSRHGQYILID